jgi:uncharacterized protein DUF6174
MKKPLLIFLAIVLSACSAFQPKSDLDRAQDKWQDASISHYRFNLSVGCFCVYRGEMPLTVEVKDGQIVSIEHQDGSPVDSANLEYFQRYATVEKIFAEIGNGFKGEAEKEADKVSVEYDETYGFPKQVSVDFIEQAVDDELGLTIDKFEALP